MTEFWFDEAAADAACAFFPKYLRHTEGEWAGRPFHLSDWERDIVRAVFGWKRPDGTRRYREIWIEIARKNGKTEFAAGLALLILLGDGEIGGQGYSMAVDKDQAKIVFNKATVMVNMSAELQEIVEAFKTSLYVPELMASFKPLSSGSANKHGFSPTFGIGDEVHEWRDGEVADVVHKGTGARRQPLEVYITTAGIHGVGFAWEKHQEALRVQAGELERDDLLVVIYAAEPDDDWTDEATWRKANPNLGISPKIEYMRAECAKAKDSPRKENAFRRFHLNQWTEQVTRWLPMDRWDACAGPVDWPDLPAYLAGRPCRGGLDLSTTTDITAFALIFPPVDGDPLWYLLPRLWIPGDTLKRRVKDEKLPYDIWDRDEAINVTAGNVVDYNAAFDQILEDAATYRIGDIAFDRWNASHLVQMLMEEGAEMVQFGQGFSSMSAPAKEFEALVLGGKLAHGDHPALRFMARNVAVREDPAGNIKPDKSASTARIDGVVAGIMALARAMVPAEEAPKSYLESANVMVL